MSDAMEFLVSVANWLVGVSLQGAILVMVILAVRWAFGKRLQARWRFALWLLLLARLVLPAGPTSSMSIYNLLPSLPEGQLESRPAIEETESSSSDGPASDPLFLAMQEPVDSSIPTMASMGREGVETSQVLPTLPQLPTPSHRAGAVIASTNAEAVSASYDGLWMILALIWLFGAVVLLAHLAVRSIGLCRRLGRDCIPCKEDVQQQLSDCQIQMGIRRRVNVMTSPAVTVPSLMGLFRPV
ncbi:MAG TPA: hypothetical protein ENL03_00865, partial [Phycisphaerae bacterium]|nr:hypothetical protein [Phycisphaerae bacterium]